MSLRNLFRLDHLTKFAATLRRDGPREALRRAAYYSRLIAFNRGRSSLPHDTGPGHAFAPFWDRAASGDSFFLTAPPAKLMNRRRIAVIGDLNLTQCRKYRVEQLVELWETAGVELTFSHYEDFRRSADILQSASHLLLYRLTASPLVSAYLYEARRLRLPVAYDIDDPLFSVPAYATYSNAAHFSADLRAHFISQAPLYAAVMNACEIVTVSTPALRDHTRCFTDRPVVVRRNFADHESLEAGARARLAAEAAGARTDGIFTIAFASGSNGHEADLLKILPEIESLFAARTDCRLLVLGRFDPAVLPENLRPRTDFRPFLGYADYLAALAGADCAVMPLVDDLFNRCKSGVRAIDAASVAVPSIVDQVSDTSVLMRSGETGLVVGPGKSWAEAISGLADDRAAARQMGVSARRHLETEWSARLAEPVVDKSLVDWVMA